MGKGSTISMKRVKMPLFEVMGENNWSWMHINEYKDHERGAKGEGMAWVMVG